MTDFLSLTRVEQSELFLLSTTKSIEQIALECGFSAKRYYEKHFMRWFNMTPTDYRNRFLEPQKQELKKRDLHYIQHFHSIDLREKYLQLDAFHSTFSNKFTYNFDLQATGCAFSHDWDLNLRISDPFECMRIAPWKSIRSAKQHLKFTNIQLYNFFHQYHSYAESPYFKYDIFSFFDFLLTLDVTIEFNLALSYLNHKSIIEELKSFLQLCAAKYGSYVMSKWMLQLDDTARTNKNNKRNILLSNQIQQILHEDFSYLNITQSDCNLINHMGKNTYVYDSMFLVPYILHHALRQNTAKTESYRELYDISNTFYACNGLFSASGEQKPIYHAWNLLSLLGDSVSLLENGIAITKKGCDFYVLLYDHMNINHSPSAKTKKESVHFILNLVNVTNTYTVTKLYLNSEDSLLKHLSCMNYPSLLSTTELAYLNESTKPSIRFSLIEKSLCEQTMSIQLTPHSAVLLILTKK